MSFGTYLLGDEILVAAAATDWTAAPTPAADDG